MPRNVFIFHPHEDGGETFDMVVEDKEHGEPTRLLCHVTIKPCFELSPYLKERGLDYNTRTEIGLALFGKERGADFVNGHPVKKQGE